MEKNPKTALLLAHHRTCRVCGRLDVREFLDRKEEMCDYGVHLLLGSIREYMAKHPEPLS